MHIYDFNQFPLSCQKKSPHCKQLYYSIISPITAATHVYETVSASWSASHRHLYTDSSGTGGSEGPDTSHLQARRHAKLLSWGKANNHCENLLFWASKGAETLVWLPVDLESDESALKSVCERLLGCLNLWRMGCSLNLSQYTFSIQSLIKIKGSARHLDSPFHIFGLLQYKQLE